MDEELDSDKIEKHFREIEMKINNLMNFVTEKEESGEGIASAEDAA
jgi:hypothetical protein